MIEVGTKVRPVKGVPCTGQLGVVRRLFVVNGMCWATVEFQTPHAGHGSRLERIGVDWLTEVPT